MITKNELPTLEVYKATLTDSLQYLKELAPVLRELEETYHGAGFNDDMVQAFLIVHLETFLRKG